MEHTMFQTDIFVLDIGMVKLAIEKNEEQSTYQMIAVTPDNEKESYAKWCFKMPPPKDSYQDTEGDVATKTPNVIKSEYKKANFYTIDPLFDNLITKIVQNEGMTLDYKELKSTTRLGLNILIRNTKTHYHLDTPFYQYVRVYNHQTGELLLTLERTDRQSPKGILNIKANKASKHSFLTTDDTADTIEKHLKDVTGIKRIYLDPNRKDIAKEEIEHILKLTGQRLG